jgi:hypothetical protein
MMDAHESIFRETRSSRRASVVSVAPVVAWPLAAVALLLLVIGLLKLIDV